MFYRAYFKLTFMLIIIAAIVITALYPYMYVSPNGFGFYIPNIGGYHVQWTFPI
jgi:hypothetical protein